MVRTSRTTEKPRSGCSKRPDFSPSLPWRAETRLVPRKAAAPRLTLVSCFTPHVSRFCGAMRERRWWAFFSILLEDREVVLLQMQLLVRHDDDFRSTLALHGLKTLPFFILQQPDDRGMGADDNPLRLWTAADPTDIAEYLIGYRGWRLRIAPPFAIVAGLGRANVGGLLSPVHEKSRSTPNRRF